MLRTFSFSCSACKARLKAPLQIIGRWRTCPSCGHRFVVPAKAIADSGPRLVFDDRAVTSSRLFQ